jgi:hypothetical protein
MSAPCQLALYPEAICRTRPPIMYFANPVRGVQALMGLGRELAMISTPKQKNPIPAGAWWCADNGRGPGKAGVIKGGCGKGWVGFEGWLSWLGNFTAEERDPCLFAVAPDVVGDAKATMEMSRPYFAKVRELGYPVALVLQDGQEGVPIPWDEIDAVFVGGSDEFKLGPVAADLCREAKRRGKWVHLGRVNSYKRFAYAASIGCDSADGTYLIYGAKRAPRMNVNLPTVLGWLAKINGRPIPRPSFGLAA